MKLKNIIIGGLFALVGLASCEMKDELIGKNNGSSDTGLLNVGVLVDGHVNNVPTTTRAAEDEAESLSPSADGFKLDVIDGEGFTKTFTYKSEGMEPIELPVGEYTVYAHSSFDFKNILFEPYYGGKQTLSIKKDLTSEVGVTCQMENTKIKLAYTSEFKSTFETWDITITAGTLIHPISEEDGTDPDAVYLKVPENTTQITVNVDAYKADGTKVSDMVNITKPKDTNSNWLGNDALTITMTPGDMKPSDPNQPSEPVDPDPDPEQPGEGEEDGDDENTSSTVSGITIKVEGIFGEQDDETISVPVTPGEDTGTDDGNEDSDGDNTGEDKPSGDGEEEASAPTIKSDYLASGITYILDDDGVTMSGNPQEALVTVLAPNKFKSVVVKITAGNDGFGDAVGVMGLADGVDVLRLDPEDEEDKTLIQALSPVPTNKDTSYTLDVAKFFGLMNVYGKTDKGPHSFNITVTDNNNLTASATLTVTIN